MDECKSKLNEYVIVLFLVIVVLIWTFTTKIIEIKSQLRDVDSTEAIVIYEDDNIIIFKK